MCHIASDRKTTIVRTIPAAIVAILPTIMTFSIHVKSFSDDLILPPQLQLSHHKEMTRIDLLYQKSKKEEAPFNIP
jgi:hypothetical protein